MKKAPHSAAARFHVGILRIGLSLSSESLQKTRFFFGGYATSSP